MRRAALLTAALLVLTGCNDYGIFGPGGRRFEGYYTYAGAVEGRFGHTVAGELIIGDTYGGRADVSIDWTYYEHGDPIFRIRTDYPAVADLDSDGYIEFDFDGELFLYGQPVWFRLSHEGRLSGRTIYGDWRLRTDLPTTDYGSFTATR
jgi:hypothetical protein